MGSGGTLRAPYTCHQLVMRASAAAGAKEDEQQVKFGAGERLRAAWPSHHPPCQVNLHTVKVDHRR